MKQKRFFLIILVVIVLLLAWYLFGKTRTIIDAETGEPLADVKIYYELSKCFADSCSMQAGFLKTDKYGKFRQKRNIIFQGLGFYGSESYLYLRQGYYPGSSSSGFRMYEKALPVKANTIPLRPYYSSEEFRINFLKGITGDRSLILSVVDSGQKFCPDTGIPDICDWVEDINSDFEECVRVLNPVTCANKRAHSSNDPSWCIKIERSDLRLPCLTGYMQSKSRNSEACGLLTETEEKDDCLKSAGLFLYDIDTCKKIQDGEKREYCIVRATPRNT